MKYKGYEAVIEYDEEDRLFFGRVINIEDVIVFDGLSVDELEQSFQQVIDEYLSTHAKLITHPLAGKLKLCGSFEVGK